MVDGLAVAGEPRRAVDQPARAHRRPGGRAELRQVAQALRAGPQDGAHESATWSPTATRVTPGADRLDDPRPLVAEHGRAARLGRAVDRVEVGVADAARGEPHEHLARPGRRKLELLDVRAAPPVCSSTAARIFTRRCRRLRLRACSARSSSSGMWQRIRWPASTSTSGGSSSSQIAPSLRGQRVWKTQPRGRVGGARDVALEPDALAARRRRSSARPRAAPPCTGGAGPSKTTSAGPSSISRPR